MESGNEVVEGWAIEGIDVLVSFLLLIHFDC